MPSIQRYSSHSNSDLFVLARQWLSSGALPFVLLFGCGLTWLSACGEETNRATPAAESSAKQAGDAKNGAKAGDDAQEPGDPESPDSKRSSGIGEREVPEAVFVETDENRDPFRSFIAVFTLVQSLPEEEFSLRPPVLLDDVALDELRLIAIISGEGGNPRAMVVDPEGKGWVVRRGDYVGRGERIRVGPGQPEREINWRVVRIRPDRIILVREDPVEVGPPVTRVMRLYPEEES